MFSISQVKECPKLSVTSKYHMPSSSAVSAVRTTVLNKLLAVKMQIPGSAMAGARAKLDVIDEVWRSQEFIRLYGLMLSL